MTGRLPDRLPGESPTPRRFLVSSARWCLLPRIPSCPPVVRHALKRSGAFPSGRFSWSAPGANGGMQYCKRVAPINAVAPTPAKKHKNRVLIRHSFVEIFKFSDLIRTDLLRTPAFLSSKKNKFILSQVHPIQKNIQIQQWWTNDSIVETYSWSIK